MAYIPSTSIRAASALAPTISDEEENALLRTLARGGSMGLTALSAVGNLLDLPGSMIRDVVTLQNPFNQLLSPLSSQGRATGRDVLEKWGALGKNREGFDWGDIAGFVGEVALDPLTYATFGLAAGARASKIAKAAGVIGKAPEVAKVLGREAGRRVSRQRVNLADLARNIPGAEPKIRQAAEAAGITDFKKLYQEPLSRAAGLGLPFARDPLLTFGKTELPSKVLDFIGEKVRGSKPVRMAYERFYRPALGMKTLRVQGPMAEAFERAEQAGRAMTSEAREMALTLENRGLSSDEIRNAVEGVRGASIAGDPSGVARRAAELQEASRVANKATGSGPTEVLQDTVDYAVRRLRADVKYDEATGKYIALTGGELLRRHEALKGYAKGTTHVDEVVMDPLFTDIIESHNKLGTNPADVVKLLKSAITEKYGGDILPGFHVFLDNKYHFVDPVNKRRYIKKKPGEFRKAKKNPDGTYTFTKGKVTETLTPRMGDRYKALANFLIDSPDARREGVFTNHYIEDLSSKLTSEASKRELTHGVFDVMAPAIRATLPFRRAGEEKRYTVARIFNQLGIDNDAGAHQILERQRGKSALAALVEDPESYNEAIKGTLRQTIDKELFSDLIQLRPGTRVPAMGSLTSGLASLTNIFKAGVLSWPARHTRDLTSGQVNNMIQGMWDLNSSIGQHYVQQGGVLRNASKIPKLRQMATERGIADLDDPQATDLLRLLYARYGPSGFHQRVDVAGDIGTQAATLQGLLEPIPGRGAAGGVLKAAGRAGKRIAGREKGLSAWKFWQVRGGFGDRADTAFGIAAASEVLGKYTDTANRLAPFINLLKKGVEPAEAMRRINLAQVNYDPLRFTPTERQLKLIFPFYSFTTRMIPYVTRELMQHPGGRLGMAIRAQRLLRSDEPGIPQYVRQTASIPLGTKPGGGKSFITGLGLMHEDPLSIPLPIPGTGGVKGLIQETLSRTSPYLKAPLELATGQSFFQRGPLGGRPLDEMDPVLGRLAMQATNLAGITDRERPFDTPQALELLAMNSPFSRLFTTARTLTDTRKTARERASILLSGLRISDISPAAQDAIIREQVESLMRGRGGKAFTRVYFSKEQLADMNMEEREVALKFQGMLNILAKRTKERKKAKQGAK